MSAIQQHFQDNVKQWFKQCKHIKSAYSGPDYDAQQIDQLRQHMIKCRVDRKLISQGPPASIAHHDKYAVFLCVDDVHDAGVLAVKKEIEEAGHTVRLRLQTNTLKCETEIDYGSIFYTPHRPDNAVMKASVGATVSTAQGNKLLISGHVGGNGTVLYSDTGLTVPLATIDHAIIQDDVDASIATLAPGVSLCPEEYDNAFPVHETVRAARIGELVSFTGAGSGYHVGTVASTNWNGDIDDFYGNTHHYINCIRVNLDGPPGSSGGDSGCPYFGQNGGVFIIGLHISGGNDNGTLYTIVSPSTAIFAALGINEVVTQ